MKCDTFHRVLVADDEQPSREYICELVKQDNRFQVVSVCENGESAIAQAAQHPLDAAFLDVQMPGVDGFRVLESIQGIRPLIVFVTAHSEYAVKAFECEAFDYIKKPIEPSRFSHVLDRLHQRLSEREDSRDAGSLASLKSETDIENKTSGAPSKRILKAVREDLLYEEDEIELIESAGNYINVRVNGDTFLVRESLENFCRSLESPNFVRVHRSYSVNVSCVRKMRYGKSGSSELFLSDVHTLPVIRIRPKQVAEILRRLVDPPSIHDDESS